MRNKIFYSIFIIMLLSLSACTDNYDLVNINRKGSEITFSAVMNTPSDSNGTRLIVGDDETNGLITKWSSEDSIILYHDYLLELNGEILENVNQPFYVFVGEKTDTPNVGIEKNTFKSFEESDNAYFDSEKYVYAFYNPRTARYSSKDRTKISVDISTKSCKAKDIAKVNYLRGDKIYVKIKSEEPTIKFKHIISVLKIEVVVNNKQNGQLHTLIKKNAALVPTSLDIYTQSGKPIDFFSRSAEYNIENNKFSLTPSGSLTIKNENGICEKYEPEGGQKDYVYSLYIPLLPSTIDTSEKMSIRLTFTDTSDKTGVLPKSYFVESDITFSMKTIEEGRIYSGRRNVGGDIKDNYINITDEGILEFESLRELEYAIYQMNEEQKKTVVGIKLLGDFIINEYDKDKDPRPEGPPFWPDEDNVTDDRKGNRFMGYGGSSGYRYLANITKTDIDYVELNGKAKARIGLPNLKSLDVTDLGDDIIDNNGTEEGLLFNGQLEMIRIKGCRKLSHSINNITVR